MPNVTFKLSQKSYRDLAKRRRNNIEGAFCSLLFLELEGVPREEITPEWVPNPDDQEGSDFRVTVDYAGRKKEARHICGILLKLLCHMPELSGDRRIKVSFPNAKGRPKALAKHGSFE